MRLIDWVKASTARWLPAAMLALGLIALSAMGGRAVAAPVNLVTNGNFTNTSVTGNGGFLCANTGGSTCNSQLSGWSGTCATGGCVGTQTPSSILVAGSNGSAWNGGYGLYWNNIGDPPAGGNTVAIDGDPKYSSTLSQSISGLNTGDTYILTFYQAASQQNGLTGATTEQWAVNLGGGATQTSTLMNTPSQGSHGWMQVTMSFVATASSEVLQFVALGTPAGEPPVCLLGDVSMFDSSPSAVAEPATLALIGVGLLGMVMVRRRSNAAV